MKTFNLLVLLTIPLFSAFEQTPQGGRPSGLLAFVAVADDPYNAFWNPAGLTLLPKLNIGLTYSRIYDLPELKQLSFAVNYNTYWGKMGLSFDQFGKPEYYQEQQILMTYAQSFGQKLSIGLNGGYRTLYLLPTYGSDYSFNMDGGILWKKSPKTRFGLFLKNMISGTLSRADEPISPSLTLGMAIFQNPHYLISFDLYQNLERIYIEDFSQFNFSQIQPELLIGQEIALWNYLKIRGGINTRILLMAGGFSIQFPLICVDYAYHFHLELGPSHFITLRYQPILDHE